LRIADETLNARQRRFAAKPSLICLLCCDCSQPLLALNGGPPRLNLQPESEVLQTSYWLCATA